MFCLPHFSAKIHGVGAVSICALPIFSGNFVTDLMGASPIFDTFLRPCNIHVLCMQKNCTDLEDISLVFAAQVPAIPYRKEGSG